MSLTRHMLDVVMDGINDTKMIAGYAQEAAAAGESHDVVDWFAIRAKTRLNALERDWKDVHEELEERAKNGKHDSELLDALECHVEHSIAEIRAKVEKL